MLGQGVRAKPRLKRDVRALISYTPILKEELYEGVVDERLVIVELG